MVSYELQNYQSVSAQVNSNLGNRFTVLFQLYEKSLGLILPDHGHMYRTLIKNYSFLLLPG